jgi:hypothetical protein
MQQELQKLLQERATLKRVRAPQQHLSRDYREYSTAIELESSNSDNGLVV